MTHPLFDLTGRVAMVTGVAQGMGRASAIALAEVGADLVITDINADGLQATAGQIETLGRRVIPMAGDITDVAHVRAIYARIDREFINNSESIISGTKKPNNLNAKKHRELKHAVETG